MNVQLQAEQLQYPNRQPDLQSRLASLQFRQEADPDPSQGGGLFEGHSRLFSSLANKSPKIWRRLNFGQSRYPPNIVFPIGIMHGGRTARAALAFPLGKIYHMHGRESIKIIPLGNNKAEQPRQPVGAMAGRSNVSRAYRFSERFAKNLRPMSAE